MNFLIAVAVVLRLVRYVLLSAVQAILLRDQSTASSYDSFSISDNTNNSVSPVTEPTSSDAAKSG